MGYAVFHRDGAGRPAVEDIATLEAAVAIVERLRNEDETHDVRVFREVPLEVKTYYKVIVADDDPSTPASVPAAPAPVGSVDEREPSVRDEADSDPAPPPVPVPAPVAAVPAPDQLPGAFPLAAPTAAAPAVEVHDAAELDADGEPTRRHSLFGRGG